MSSEIAIPAANPTFMTEGRAACGEPDVNPEWWVDAEITRRRARLDRRARKAIRVCKDKCELRERCLAWAVREHQSGIWGGELLNAGKVVTPRG